MTSGGSVLVLGGDGFFGRYLTRELLQRTEARVVVGGRHPRRGRDPRAGFLRCDATDGRSIADAARGFDVLANCAGPFVSASTAPLEAAIEGGAHYVDISEDRAFDQRVRIYDEAARDAGVAVLSGCSVVPTSSILIARSHELQVVESVRTFAAPDTYRHRGRAMFWTMLYGAGRPMVGLRDGKPFRTRGWSDAEWVSFPPPVGRRLVYRVLEMSDQDRVPEALGARTVEFKVGSEFPLLNRAVSALGRIRGWADIPLETLTTPVRIASWIAGAAGKDGGAVMVETVGAIDGHACAVWTGLTLQRHGGRLPILPASIAIERLLRGEFVERGVRMADWIEPAAFLGEIRGRGVSIWVRNETRSP